MLGRKTYVKRGFNWMRQGHSLTNLFVLNHSSRFTQLINSFNKRKQGKMRVGTPLFLDIQLLEILDAISRQLNQKSKKKFQKRVDSWS